MYKRKRAEEPDIKKANTHFNKGMQLLENYQTYAPEEQETKLNEAITAFARSRTLYTNSQLTPGSTEMTLAEVAHYKGKALSAKAGLQAQNGQYEEAILSYRESYAELKYTAEELYFNRLGSTDSLQAYHGCYDVKITLALNHMNRSDCHDKIGDPDGSNKWRDAALKEFSAIRKGYASFLASSDGAAQASLISELEKETRNLQAAHPLPDLETPTKTWSEKMQDERTEDTLLQGPAAVVTTPVYDLAIYAIQSPKGRSHFL